MNIALCALPTTIRNKENKIVQIESKYLYRTSSPYNIYLLAAIMEHAGYEIVIKDWISNDFDIEEALKELLDFDVVMMSCPSWAWIPVKFLIESLHSIKKDQILVLGGIHEPLFYEETIKEIPVNYVVYGEGEKAVVPLLKAIEKKISPGEVPGLIYKENGKIHKNPPAPLLTGEELGNLPVPLYEGLPSGICKWLAIESSRGCVNNCTFCSVPYKKSWRPLGAKAFVDRIEAYLPFLPRVFTGEFLIIDDSFIINVKRAREIAGELKKRKIVMKAIWNGQVKELFEKEMLSDLAPYTGGILLGIESFDRETLRKIGKKFSPEDILAATQVAKDLGISEKLIVSFIIGFPWQNKEMIISEIDRIYDLICTTGGIAIINWLILNPGSQMWNEYNRGKNVPFDNHVTRWREWYEGFSPEDMHEIIMYITYLQTTLPDGSYRIQAFSRPFKKL